MQADHRSYLVNVSAGDCIRKGVEGLKALGVDVGPLDGFRFEIAHFGPFEVTQKYGDSPLEPWQARLHACEFLIVFADQARDFCEIQGAADPDFDGWPLLAVANAAIELSERAYAQLPPSPSVVEPPSRIR